MIDLRFSPCCLPNFSLFLGRRPLVGDGNSVLDYLWLSTDTPSEVLNPQLPTECNQGWLP